MATAVQQPRASAATKTEKYVDTKRKDDIRHANIIAAKAVADAVRTSLGPKGMDKMLCTSSGDVIITNDGATILNKMEVTQPAAKMLVELSKSQDIVAGDGTTTVVVIAGAILKQCVNLLSKGVHPTIMSEAFHRASEKAVEVLTAMAIPVELTDRESLVKSASTSLNSKVVSQYSTLLAPLAVDAVLNVVDPAKPDVVDLRDIRVLKKLGGTVDDTEMVKGLVFDKKASHTAGGPTRIENAKIGVIQFQISPPKTDIEQNIVVSDYTMMDRILKEERNYILGMIKKIKATGCNVLLIQKSILRDAVTDLSLHYLSKAKILVVKDVERDEIEFITKTLNCFVILGDFGFSTCTFDNGDTQCSTQAFIGTSYWMAPEVKEQRHSCGPEVDIWSFGITALELSQGHDSFNKYSPTKVVQTYLQGLNGGNNYERHKKLSKPFLEMIAKCLKKDPLKRPSAIKLLKHSFFKNAPNSEVVAETVFNGLPPLGDQFKALKLKEAGIFEQKKVASDEKEDQSQSEHKRGMSSWNFHLEDLEFRSSSIQDDEELYSTKAIENPNRMKEIESMVKTESVGAESNGQGGDHMVQVQSRSLEASMPLQFPNGPKENVDIFEGDINPYSMPEMECIKFKDHKLVVLQAQKDDASIAQDYEHALEKEDSPLEDGHCVSEQSHNVGSGPLAGDKSNRHQHQPKLEQSSSRLPNFHRVNVTHSADCIYRRTNVAGNRDSSGEMSTVPAVQKKGRFKVTSQNLDPEPPTIVPCSTSSTSNVAMSTILPFMQNISERNDTQREQIVNLIKSLSQGKISSVHLSNPGSKTSSCNGFDNLMIEAPSERERELLQQVVELQIRVTNIAHEIQKGKTMNIQLERQLSVLQQRKEADQKR